MTITLTVEDGTGVTGANTYVTAADVNNYAAQHPTASNNWATLTDDQKGEAILAAAGYLEVAYRWYGYIKDARQAMRWPRSKNYDSEGQIIPPGTIPKELKAAQIQLAIIANSDPTVLDTTIESMAPLKSMAIDTLRLEFQGKQDVSTTAATGTRYPQIEFLLRSIGVLRDNTEMDNRKTQGTY